MAEERTTKNANPFGNPEKGITSVAAKTLLEWLGTIALVLAFFLFLIWGATFILPEGTSLINLDGSGGVDQGTEQSTNNLANMSKGEISIISSGEPIAAMLGEVHKTVKHRSAKGILWVDALMGIQLFDQDAIKTGGASHAIIKFDDSNKLHLGPDSLVIVRQLEEDPWLVERQPAVVMMEGELRGTMVASLAKKATKVEVVIPGGVARISPKKDSDEPIDYKIKVNPDQSASVVVFSGVAEVEAQNRKVALAANQITRVIKGAAPTKPAQLPDDAKVIGPADDYVTYYREFPQEVTFNWEKTKEGQYRLIIAKDSLYEDVVYDEIVRANQFIHGDLHHGGYFWRVASITDDGTEGKYSNTHRIKVIQDLEPPLLKVNYPDKTVTSDRYLLVGSVEPGATLIVNGIEVDVDEQGRFEIEIKLKKGINVVVAQAVDMAGNATFVSERVTREF